SEEDEDAEGSRLPLLIVLALLVLAMFGGVVWLAYTQGVARGRTETPVLTAANGPARVAPANPGGADQPYKGFKIYEQPAPPDEDTASPAKAAPDQSAATLSPPPATKPAIIAAPAKAVAAAPEAKPAPAPAEVKAPAAPAAKPAPKPAASPSSVAAATAPPRTLPSAAPAKPVGVPAPSPAATPAPASGAYVLQIGAYKSQAEADAAWKTYSRAHAALLSGYGPDVQKADLGDKGTWYRLRIAGFSDKDAASALCDRLKAEQGACFLGK